MNQLFLRAGTPDDDNRDYLPERIKNSDIVVNENGNNSQPYPERLCEFHDALTDDGKEDTAGNLLARRPDDGLGAGHLHLVDDDGRDA